MIERLRRNREVVSFESRSRPGRVKPKTLTKVVFARSQNARHLKVRTTGLLDMALKPEVPCSDRRQHVKDPSLLWTALALIAYHWSKLLHLQQLMTSQY